MVVRVRGNSMKSGYGKKAKVPKVKKAAPKKKKAVKKK